MRNTGIDNKKMSKSLGNFFTVRDISEKYDLQVLRFFMLNAHYRMPLNFSAELMESAKNSLDRIVNAAENLKFLIKNNAKESIDEEEQSLLNEAKKFSESFDAAMDDDFNTADAITAVFELVKFINLNASAEHSKEYLEALFKELVTLTDILGIIVDKEEELLDADVEALIKERTQARKNKDFARADEIRQKLSDMGIVLEDTREGVKWHRA